MPYFLLTLAVAGVGAFIVTKLVTNSLEERFDNQLLDAGRVVAERMVDYENERLQVFRAVAGTDNVPESLAAGDAESLAGLVPQIVANSSTDAVVLLNREGEQIYSWRRVTGQAAGGTVEGPDFSELEGVRLVLEGFEDAFGNKRVLLVDTPDGHTLYTVGPVMLDGVQAGAVLVGSDVRKMVIALTESAVARVTLYDPQGRVIETTLGLSADVADLPETEERPVTVISLLQESPEQYRVVTEGAASQVPIRQAVVLNQRYRLAYGDWRLRDQSFGFFSVALPSNFIVNTAATSRNLLSLVFFLATLAVFSLGLLISQRIIQPLNRLVQVSRAVSEGDLDQRTQIQRADEIGVLARSFDAMTENLAERNRQLIERASELQAILHSIADGVIVLDTNEQIITINAAAERLLVDMSQDFWKGSLRELAASVVSGNHSQPLEMSDSQPKRYQAGKRMFSALAAPVETPSGRKLGTVIVLRDVTREAEAEHLKDSFVTSVSHELRTPLTVVKVYNDLLLKTAGDLLTEQHLNFIRKIGQSTQQLERHINQLINISEIQAGTLYLQKEAVDFPDLVRGVAENWRGPIEQKGVALEVVIPEQPYVVHGDGSHLNWAVENLFSNAYNYTESGGRIWVRVFTKNGDVRLEVEDTGVGIAPADQPHIFDRFYRADSELHYEVRGVGLGLYITRSIIELHGGRLWVESEPGLGSTFSLALPLTTVVPSGEQLVREQ
ncbi:MAG: ATP-binding protein [Chloroflexi bacterium]|nr:ATP-binding protein [Chloroflexota bacterium]MCI0578390.1 ATP-binding protein [Chloroflexota bacterium]MCI0647613.1 ATP-binding protein [Chloroflexota bacterium]MCI0730418.1 ATP-binding protein [Chloroflexota bacterium]